MTELTIECLHDPECYATLSKAAQKLTVTISCWDQMLSIELTPEERKKFVDVLDGPMAEFEVSDTIARRDDGTVFYLRCVGEIQGSGQYRCLSLENDVVDAEVTMYKEDQAALRRFVGFSAYLAADGSCLNEKPVFNL